MLYNQTYNLDQVAFASEGLKDAQQTVYSYSILKKFYFHDVLHPDSQTYDTNVFIWADDCNEGSQ